MTSDHQPTPSKFLRLSLAATVAALAIVATGSAFAAPSRTVSATGAALKAPAKLRGQAGVAAAEPVLYSQTNKADDDGVYSQDAEAAFDSFDSQGADDFVVPAGASWAISRVTAKGFFTQPDLVAISGVRVEFYSSGAGVPAAVLATVMVPPVDVKVLGGNLILDMPPVVLAGGTVRKPKNVSYWVSVQPVMDFDTAGQWFWATRESELNKGAVWRNPGAGFDDGCVAYTNLATCLGKDGKRDLLFELRGVSTPLAQ